MKCCAAVVISIVCFLVMIDTARADDKGEAKKHFEAGFTLMEQRNFKAASMEFELSVKLYANENNLYNLANSYRGERRFEEALATFNRILVEFKDKLDDELRTDVLNQISMIKKYVSRLDVQTIPSGAVIKVDGKEVGTSPLKAPLTMIPGVHVIEASLLGYDIGNQQVTLVSGVDKSVTITLQVPKSSLTIAADQPGAVVSLNGREIGFTPITVPVTLDAGLHSVSMKKEGFEPTQQEIELKVGENKSIQFMLKPLPKAPSTIDLSEQAEKDKPKNKSKLKPLVWALVGGTAALACASGALWGVTATKWSFREDSVETINSGEWDFSNPQDVTDEQSERDYANELGQEIPKWNKAAVAMTVVTAAAAAATTVVGILMKRGKESSASTVSVGPGGLEVSF
jgi:hypothetical protein